MKFYSAVVLASIISSASFIYAGGWTCGTLSSFKSIVDLDVLHSALEGRALLSIESVTIAQEYLAKAEYIGSGGGKECATIQLDNGIVEISKFVSCEE